MPGLEPWPNSVSIPDAEIDPLPSQIAQTSGRQELKLDLRMSGMQSRIARNQPMCCQCTRESDAYLAELN